MKKQLHSCSLIYVDKKMSMRRLGSWEPMEFNIKLTVPKLIGEACLKVIKKKLKELR